MELIVTTPEQLRSIVFAAVQDCTKTLAPSPQPINSERLLTRKETAKKLQISLQTLHDWSKRGLLKSYIIGGRVFYKESEIDSALTEVQTVKY